MTPKTISKMKTVSTMKYERPKTNKQKIKNLEKQTQQRKGNFKRTVNNIYRELRDVVSVKQEWIIIIKR